MRSLLRPTIVGSIALTTTLASCQSPLPVNLAEGDWKILEKDSLYQVAINTHSIRRRGSSVWFWVHTQFRSSTSGEVEQEFVYFSVDCEAKTIQLRRNITFNARGERITDENYGDSNPPKSAPRNDPTLKYACARR